MQPIISVENLGKKYRIKKGENKAPYRTLRETLTELPGRLAGKTTRGAYEDFWALQDVSFDVMPGERVGIIGRNGAGKSTLLKLLSRITEPSKGKITLRGRVASLLEVGTGFHPELTGRENIYLNGAILGMHRSEIKRKFDEIVDFAGVEKFLDTPVKRYSSGMYVRLAFAVAAHLEPEILIVDEVLAVGDAEFQKKCLGKMEEVSKGQGRTVLFVSHNMAAVNKLCSIGFLLEHGACSFQGPIHQVIDSYHSSKRTTVSRPHQKTMPFADFYFVNIFPSDTQGKEQSQYTNSESVCLSMGIFVPHQDQRIELAVSLYDSNKNRIFTIHKPLKEYTDTNGIINLLLQFPPGFITPGNYSWLMCLIIHGQAQYDLNDDVCPFSIVDTGSDFAQYPAGSYGAISPIYTLHKQEDVLLEKSIT